MQAQCNIAFYRFTALDDLSSLKKRWFAALEQLGVKGTIILAPEGINGFLCGSSEAIEKALTFLGSVPGLEGLRGKKSESKSIPFRKLCIKLKKEIVTFRVPGFPAQKIPTKRLQPKELAEWYAQGREFIALDTRNAFEAKLGTFENATTLDIANFVDLPQAAQTFPEEWKKKPVVTFCTGGIRCEKAAPYLENLGFEEVYQLEDGILGYFEHVGGAHWQGECFVFDDRVAVGPDLLPTGAFLCKQCQWPNPRHSATCSHCGRALGEI